MSLGGHEEAVFGITAAFAPASARIATASGKTIRIWDLGNGAQIRVLRHESQSVIGLSVLLGFLTDGA